MASAPKILVHEPPEDVAARNWNAIPVTAGLSPLHPIPQLQGPFEESIVETIDDFGDARVVEMDAQTRRRELLENDHYERLCGRRWRQRASEK